MGDYPVLLSSSDTHLARTLTTSINCKHVATIKKKGLCPMLANIQHAAFMTASIFHISCCIIFLPCLQQTFVFAVTYSISCFPLLLWPTFPLGSIKVLYHLIYLWCFQATRRPFSLIHLHKWWQINTRWYVTLPRKTRHASTAWYCWSCEISLMSWRGGMRSTVGLTVLCLDMLVLYLLCTWQPLQ